MTGFDGDVGQAELGSAPGRRRRSGRCRPGRSARTSARSSPMRSLGDQPALVHHPDVAAHLVDLGEQVAGDQDRRPRRRPGRRSGAAPRGCPAGRGRWSARRAPAGRAASAARWRWPAAAACRGSTRGSACRPRPAGRPGPAPRRSGRRGRARVAGPVGRVQPGQIGPAGEVGVEGRPLDQRADPAQHAADCRPASAAPSSSISPAVGRDQAEQHPDGGGLAGAVRARGSRTPHRSGTSRSMWSTTTWRRNRLVRSGGRDRRAPTDHREVARAGSCAGRPLNRRAIDRASVRLDRADGQPAVVGEHRRERRAGEQPARAPGRP